MRERADYTEGSLTVMGFLPCDMRQVGTAGTVRTGDVPGNPGDSALQRLIARSTRGLIGGRTARPRRNREDTHRADARALSVQCPSPCMFRCIDRQGPPNHRAKWQDAWVGRFHAPSHANRSFRSKRKDLIRIGIGRGPLHDVEGEVGGLMAVVACIGERVERRFEPLCVFLLNRCP